MKRVHARETVATLRPGGLWPAAAGALLLGLVASGSARAQAAPPEDAAPPPPERLVVAFEHRSRVEGFTHPFRLDELGPTRVLAFRTRLQVALPKIVGPLGAVVELQDSRSGWNDEPFVVEARDINYLDFLQAHLRVASDRLPGQRASGGILLGRFTLDLGRRRLVARNGMRNTTNTFDGAQGWLSVGDQVDARLFVTRPVRLYPTELDRSEGGRLFWGGALGLARWPRVRAEVYALRLDESRDTLTRRRLTTLGARVYRNPAPGALDYEVDGAWQSGSRQGLDHQASFLHLEAGFSFGSARARVAALYDRASGDPDPGDGRSGRFDSLFGARRFEYAPTGHLRSLLPRQHHRAGGAGVPGPGAVGGDPGRAPRPLARRGPRRVGGIGPRGPDRGVRAASSAITSRRASGGESGAGCWWRRAGPTSSRAPTWTASPEAPGRRTPTTSRSVSRSATWSSRGDGVPRAAPRVACRAT